MIEIWKPVIDYEGLYEVSNLGNVRSLSHYVTNTLGKTDYKHGKVLKPTIEYTGYCMVGLYKNRKVKYKLVHRLVAQAFIPNIDNLPQVNHKDENKQNNRVDNLEWCTNKYNNTYGSLPQRQSQAKIGEKNPNYGKKLSYEVRQKLSKSHSGVRNAMYGKHHSEETKRKISETKKKRGGL